MEKQQCVACGCNLGNAGLILMIDPNKPRGARKRDYIVGYHCDNTSCEKESWLIVCKRLQAKPV